jgi:DNA transposition AAA+ family ATPase
MKNAESLMFDYLTTYRSTINLAGLAAQVGTSRQALNSFLDGKRGLPARVQENLSKFLHEQAAQVASIPKPQE